MAKFVIRAGDNYPKDVKMGSTMIKTTTKVSLVAIKALIKANNHTQLLQQAETVLSFVKADIENKGAIFSTAEREKITESLSAVVQHFKKDGMTDETRHWEEDVPNILKDFNRLNAN